MLHKLAEYQHDIHLRRPGAKKALEDFKAQQVEMVTDILEVVPTSILTWWNRAERQYSSSTRGNGGATNLPWGVIRINTLSFTCGLSRKSFIVSERNRALTFTHSASSPSSSSWDTQPVMWLLSIRLASVNNQPYLLIEVRVSVNYRAIIKD